MVTLMIGIWMHFTTNDSTPSKADCKLNSVKICRVRTTASSYNTRNLFYSFIYFKSNVFMSKEHFLYGVYDGGWPDSTDQHQSAWSLFKNRRAQGAWNCVHTKVFANARPVTSMHGNCCTQEHFTSLSTETHMLPSPSITRRNIHDTSCLYLR